MRQLPEWKKINIYKLSLRYEISELGLVRIARTQVILKNEFKESGKRMIYLSFKGGGNVFSIDELIYKTFNKDAKYKIVVKVERSFIKHKQFSKNEDDYGLRENKRHWEKIKEYIRMTNYIKNSES